MLCRNKNWITTLSGYNLAWQDEDGTWIPNQCLVGSSITDETLGRLLQCQVSDGSVVSLGKQIAQVHRNESGLIIDLVLVWK
jgi:hypothetical protein